ncbi:centrosomal protein of 290 kDa-like isoform X2 [Ostrea edulis]|uniref:centrosomal protein of 290 kDa-like isoform X2 n=1 Tax=Ostrea edulis TaxID=37623 RepID=UPI0024AEEBA5|nr:centrosomal protein of 290 kDa-like isoform X2 [Ostrea edulis]
MSFPDIHTCIQLTAENEKLKKKCWKLKVQRDDIQLELSNLKQKQQREELLKNYVTTRESSTQTEGTRLWQPVMAVKKKEEPSFKADVDQTNKLLSLHNQMMRRYEKEVKMNMMHVETITDLNIRISELEQQLKEEKNTRMSVERQVMNQQPMKKTVEQYSTEKGKTGMRDKYEKVAKECDRIKKENEKLRAELKGLDFGFFEEIEDLKFGLRQATKLNKEYEKTLRKVCIQFGVPYPHPERCIKGPSGELYPYPKRGVKGPNGEINNDFCVKGPS